MEKINYLATYRLGLFSTKHIVSGLVEKEEEHFTPSSDFVERSRERESYVAAYRGEYFDRVFTDASVRKDDNKPFVDFTTWHADVSLSLKEIALRPHASVGTGVALENVRAVRVRRRDLRRKSQPEGGAVLQLGCGS